jgi:hypothetical protein
VLSPPWVLLEEELLFLYYRHRRRIHKSEHQTTEKQQTFQASFALEFSRLSTKKQVLIRRAPSKHPAFDSVNHPQ